MKHIGLILLIGFLITSCNQVKKEKSNPGILEQKELNEVVENFDWLIGNWKRLHEEEGKDTFEIWKKIKDTEYSGIGFTMQNRDTIWQENLQLIKTAKGKWNLTIKSPEDPESITFTGIHHNENEFSCENNDIDFPNKIKYWKNGEKINATVSGGEMKISFEFEKSNESK